MNKTKVVAAVVIVLGTFWPHEAKVQTASLGGGSRTISNDCDQLAGIRSDSTLPPGIRGVQLSSINISQAQNACRRAIAAFPSEPRFFFELARVYHAAKDYDQAARYYRKAADMGHASATFQLGYWYELGLGVLKDEAESVRLYRKAAGLGDKYAISAVQRIEQNGKLAAHKADTQTGNYAARPQAQSAPPTECDRMAARPRNPNNPPGIQGIEFNRIDPMKAVRECQNASRQYPAEPRLASNLGRALNAAKEYDKSLQMYQKAIELGDPSAMVALGQFLRDGKFITKNYDAAVSLFRRAAALGDPNAYSALGFAYQEGEGVTKSYADAFHNYWMAGKAGEPNGYFAIGRMYRYGLGVKQDDNEAVVYYRYAADLGHPTSLKILSEAYIDGTGVGRNLDTAWDYASKAIAAGNEDAKSILESISTARAAAKQGPSLEDTIEFMQRKASDLGDFVRNDTTKEGYPISYDHKLSIKIEKGELLTSITSASIIDRKNTNYDKKLLYDTRLYSERTKLRALNNHVDFEERGLVKGNCTLKYECTKGNCISSSEKVTVWFYPGSEAIAGLPIQKVINSTDVILKDMRSCERLKSALSHLISLYGGSSKSDPF